MADRSQERASRAEARRRARRASRGEPADVEQAEPESPSAEPPARSGGFFNRLFPAAPPLDRPDPLEGYEGSGPLRPLTERLYLLRANPLAWVMPAILAAFSYYSSVAYATNLIGVISTFLLFASLVIAGWMGWQRPTLYGTTAAIVAYLLTVSLVLWAYAQQDVPPEAFGQPAGVVTQLVVQGAIQAAIGFIGGWYGGYLRRRQAQMRGQSNRRR